MPVSPMPRSLATGHSQAVSSELVRSWQLARLSIAVDTHRPTRPPAGSRAWPLTSLVHASHGDRRPQDRGRGGVLTFPWARQFGSFFCLNHQDRKNLWESEKGICFQYINIYGIKKSGKYPRELLVYTGQAEAIQV